MQTVPPLASIPVFYDARMVADAQSYSPSAGKPRRSSKAGRRCVCRSRSSPSRHCRECAGNSAYAFLVDGVLEGRTKNGFGNCLMAVANTLPWTSGAMLAAACEALANRQVAVAPVSGFHHARHDHAAGYCTFNGLIVAARVLLAERRVKRVGILDCDMHYGDGTEQIIRHLGLSASIKHITVGRDFGRPAQAEQFLRELPEMVADFQGCDVILYQAGADPHVDDPLGGWLTNAQLAQRDRTVFEHCKRQGIPVAWNLAGGYQTPLRRVLDIHDATLQACIEIYLDQP